MEFYVVAMTERYTGKGIGFEGNPSPQSLTTQVVGLSWFPTVGYYTKSSCQKEFVP